MSNRSVREIAHAFISEGIAKADMSVFDALLAEGIVVETGLSPAGSILGREMYPVLKDAVLGSLKTVE